MILIGLTTLIVFLQSSGEASLGLRKNGSDPDKSANGKPAIPSPLITHPQDGSIQFIRAASSLDLGKHGREDTLSVTIAMMTSPTENSSVTRTYLEDFSPFANPERGFFIQGRTQEQPPDNPDRWPGINQRGVKQKRDTENLRLVRQYYHLDLYKTRGIPQSYLDILQDDLDFIREAGMKIIPRFTYSWDRASIQPGDKNDTTKEWTLKHIETLMPILAENADVIAFVEMGFVGLWGEFWGSDSGWTTDRRDYGSCSTLQNYIETFPGRQSDREEIISRVLELLPDGIKLALRYPRDKQAMFLDDPSTSTSLPLTSREAHTPLWKSRIGFHNDSLFTGNADEQNTFFSCDIDNATFVKSQVDWLNQDALFVPQGGELGCPYEPEYGNCQNAIEGLAERHFDALNRGYCPETLQAWRDQGCFDEITAHLGYRIRLISTTIIQTLLNPGDQLNLQFKLVNDGFGKIYNERSLEVVLRHKLTGAEYFLPLYGHDPRFWLPNEIQKIGFTSLIPARGLPNGGYDIFLFLPDPDPELRFYSVKNEFGNPLIPSWSPYAIRLANKEVWDESTGYNDLLIDLIISRGK